MEGARDWEVPRLSLSWSEMADGKPWRLKRGKHFRGDPKSVSKEAEAAAREMGRAVITSKDSSGKYEYLWVQFVDYMVSRGEPCPHCRGEVLTKHSNVLATCDSCGSSLKLVEPKADPNSSIRRTDGQGSVPGRPEASSSGEPPKRRFDRGQHAEILATRLLSAEGTERERILVSEEAVLEISYRFHAAGLSVQAGAIFVVDEALALQSAQPSPVVLEWSGVYTAALRLPANRFAEGSYDVAVTALVLTDEGTSESLVRRNALSFEVVLETAEDETRQESAAKVRGGSGSLVWSVVARPGDGRADGHDGARADDEREGRLE